MSDPNPDDQCELFGYEFCLLCGKCEPKSLLNLFYGTCLDCLMVNAAKRLCESQIDIPNNKTIITYHTSLVAALHEDYKSVFGEEKLPRGAMGSHHIAQALKTLFPVEHLAARAVVRMRFGLQPFSTHQVRNGEALEAIETLRRRLFYDTDHASSAEDAQTDQPEQ